LHVSVTEGRGPRRPGVVGHRGLDPDAMRSVRGLPVVDPLTAFVQVGALLLLDGLVAVGDALCGSWSPWPEARERSPSDLNAHLASLGRARGVSALHRAMLHVRPGVESPKETELRLLLLRAGLPEPEINAKTYDSAGRYLGNPDLRYVHERVSIEYEGDEHRRDPARWRRDIRRRERFADAGWRTIRVTEADLRGSPPVSSSIGSGVPSSADHLVEWSASVLHRGAKDVL
jgi:very-short-patch-repair endonuclease